MTKIKEINSQDKKIDAHKVCNELKVNQNTRNYILHKHKLVNLSLKDWKILLKKDGLSY